MTPFRKKVEVAQSFFNRDQEEAELDIDTEEEDEDGENS